MVDLMEIREKKEDWRQIEGLVSCYIIIIIIVDSLVHPWSIFTYEHKTETKMKRRRIETKG